MAAQSALVNISEMIDLSIGTPEVGVVDFCMLHAVLHCLAQQLHIQSKVVELRSSVSQLPVGREPAVTLNVSEFIVDKDDKAGTPKPLAAGTSLEPGEETILVVERVKFTTSETKKTPPKTGPAQLTAKTSPAGKAPVSAADQAQGGGGAPGGAGADRLSLVTTSRFNVLEAAVNDLKGVVYGLTPTNEQIMEGVRSQSNLKGITDMWASMNITSRLDAAENAIAKISSLVEDVIKEVPDLKEFASKAALVVAETRPPTPTPGGAGSVPATPRSIEVHGGGFAGGPGVQGGPAGVAVTPGQVTYPPTAPAQGMAKFINSAVPSTSGFAPMDKLEGIAKNVNDLRKDVDSLYVTFYKTMDDIGVEPAQTDSSPSSALLVNMKNIKAQPAQGTFGGPGGFAGGQGVVQSGPGGFAGGQGVVQGGPGGIAGGQGVVQGGPGGFAGGQGVVQGGPGGFAGGPGGQGGPAGVAGAPGQISYPPAAPAQGMEKFMHSAATSMSGFAPMDNLEGIAKNINDLRKDVDNLYVMFYKTMDGLGIEPAQTDSIPSAALLTNMKNIKAQPAKGPFAGPGGFAGGPGGPQGGPGRIQSGPEGVTEAGHFQQDGGYPQDGGGGYPQGGGYGGGFQQNGGFADLMQRIMNAEKRIQDCCESINRHEGILGDKVSYLQDQVDYVLKQMGINTDEIVKTTKSLSPDVIQDLEGLMQLFNTVQGMQEQLKEVHDTALQLAAEKEDRKRHINIILEQIELLKVIKLDREDMVEAMADKADLRMLARKVSHDTFEMACDDLAKGIELAIGKLNMQEALWQQALDDIQREIETKLDKMELCPVKDFFNSKLKQLQENLKQLASLRREVEAAGSKRKLLRDVNCISCDAQVVMAMESGPCMPGSKPLHATLSMKPYLSYELDTIRKAQSAHVPQRNMHDWETIGKQMDHPKQLQKVRSETDKHICNRYCGGSHTVTTPAQRVARMGHFIKQWGPDVLPLTSGLAAGDDGKMYKVATGESALAGAEWRA